MQNQTSVLENPLKELNGKKIPAGQINGKKLYIKISTFPHNIEESKENVKLLEMLQMSNLWPDYLLENDYLSAHTRIDASGKKNECQALKDRFNQKVRPDVNYTNFSLIDEDGNILGLITGNVFPNNKQPILNSEGRNIEFDKINGISFDNQIISSEIRGQGLGTEFLDKIYEIYEVQAGKKPSVLSTYSKSSVEKGRDMRFKEKFGGNVSFAQVGGFKMMISENPNLPIEKNPKFLTEKIDLDKAMLLTESEKDAFKYADPINLSSLTDFGQKKYHLPIEPGSNYPKNIFRNGEWTQTDKIISLKKNDTLLQKELF